MRYQVKELGAHENDTPVRFYVQDTELGYATDLMVEEEAIKTAEMLNAKGVSTMDEFKARVLEMFEISEARLDELEAKPDKSLTTGVGFGILAETARNNMLRELLGKDSREDEAANG